LGQSLLAGAGVGVVLLAGKDPLVQADRVLVPARQPVGPGKVVTGHQRVRVVRAEHPLPGLQVFLVEPDNFGKTAGDPVAAGQHITGGQGLRMVRAEITQIAGQRPLEP
jgi:hypothetical protein